MKDVKGYEGRYLISEDGVIESLMSNRTLASWEKYSGKNFIGLSVDLYDDTGKRHQHYVKHLVFDTYIDKDRSKLDVIHEDGNKYNVHFTNLILSPRSKSVRHYESTSIGPSNTARMGIKRR